MGFYSRVLFPWGMNWLMSGEPFDSARANLLNRVSGKVLEIGFGSGLNLPHYPHSLSALTAIDPNPGMRRYAEARMLQSPIKVEHCELNGEALPMADASFDTVVSTWTLCSIEHAEQALAEIHRVLKPGGRFVFLEHGLSDEPGIQRWQHRLNPIQKVIGDGCNLNRNIRELVAAAGFRSLEVENFYLEKTPRLLGYMYRGEALK
ncbi:class I SAM-dependent methyltransferase [Sulfuriflexus mobilis]|uniref:class I SAM-dependent methyltransferase n=1 Tax=Sulfuriflexus mobilis TaxID=1811807 RepID=UPI000F81E841|nr:class I SAM-dependent methyltransferase [Sulfuriflexus mobilis]